jgi:Fe-S cluster assembly protein SufD
MIQTQNETVVDQAIPGFSESDFGRIGQGEPASLRAKREEAFDIYTALPAPTAFTEDWRRTNPALFPYADFTPLPPLPRLKESPGGDEVRDDQFDVVVSVSEQGFHIDDRSQLIERGDLEVSSLSELAEKDPDTLQTYLQGEALSPHIGKFEALNAAFWNLGLFIRVPDGKDIKRGILIRHEYDAPSRSLVYRALIVMGRSASLGITETCRTPSGHPFLVIADKEMYLDDAARLKTVILKDWGNETYLLGNDMARVGRDAQVDQINLNFGGKVSKVKFGSDLAGPNSAAELDGLFFTSGEQHIDQTTWQVHSSPDTYSRLLYKGAVRDTSQSVYQGIIKAKPGAIRVDAYQTNNNIVLDDGARAHTIPGLLIDADDLKCSHGATVGNLDPDQIFYLRARGIEDAEARRLVMLGFFGEVIERIPQDFIRERVQEIVRERMPNS